MAFDLCRKEMSLTSPNFPDRRHKINFIISSSCILRYRISFERMSESLKKCSTEHIIKEIFELPPFRYFSRKYEASTLPFRCCSRSSENSRIVIIIFYRHITKSCAVRLFCVRSSAMLRSVKCYKCFHKFIIREKATMITKYCKTNNCFP